jgi:hypothetical protein
LQFAQTQAKLYQTQTEERVWADVAHVLLNSPEFIYLR